MKWISIDDRLPEDLTECFAWHPDSKWHFAYRLGYIWYDDDTGKKIGFYDYDDFNRHEGVTHWMPLPEPPQ